LHAVLETALSPPGLLHAFDACEAREVRYCCEQDDRILKIEEFLNGGGTGSCDKFQDEDLFKICRLWLCIDYFVSCALDWLASEAKISLSGKEQKEEWKTLSEVERLRVQESFCRFELYRRLFGGPYVLNGLDDIDLRMELLDLFSPRERIGIQTVFDYLVDKVHQFIDGLCVHLADQMKYAGYDEESLEYVENLGGQGWVELESTIDSLNLGVFAEHANQVVAFLVELGLPFLRRLLKGKAPKRAISLLASIDSLGRERREHFDDVFGAFQEQEENANALEQPRWGTRGLIPQASIQDLAAPEYRWLGSVFWDTGRIERAGASPGPVRRIANTRA
jgi:hypothetical protein